MHCVIGTGLLVHVGRSIDADVEQFIIIISRTEGESPISCVDKTLPNHCPGKKKIKCGPYLTFFPQADKIVRDFWDDVAAVVAYGAATKFWLGVQDLLTQLFHLGVVAVEQEVASQLFEAVHGAKPTVFPQTVSLIWTTKQELNY